MNAEAQYPSMTEVRKFLKDADSYDATLSDHEMLQPYQVLQDSEDQIPSTSAPTKHVQQEQSEEELDVDIIDIVDVFNSVPTTHKPLKRISLSPKYSPPFYCTPKIINLGNKQRACPIANCHLELLAKYSNYQRQPVFPAPWGKAVQSVSSFNGSLMRKNKRLEETTSSSQKNVGVDQLFEAIKEDESSVEDCEIYVSKSGRITKRKIYTENVDDNANKWKKRSKPILNDEEDAKKRHPKKRSKLFADTTNSPRTDKIFEKLKEGDLRKKEAEREMEKFSETLQNWSSELVHSGEPFIRRRVVPPSCAKKAGGAENTPISEEYSDSIRMLVLLENGEQRLITFTLPKEVCTIQEILEQVGVPFHPDAKIECTETNHAGINYLVTVGIQHQENSNQDETPDAEELNSQSTSQKADSVVSAETAALEIPTSEPPAEIETPRFVAGLLAVCNHCGYISENFNRCLRCRFKLPEDVKTRPALNNSAAHGKNSDALKAFPTMQDKKPTPQKNSNMSGASTSTFRFVETAATAHPIPQDTASVENYMDRQRLGQDIGKDLIIEMQGVSDTIKNNAGILSSNDLQEIERRLSSMEERLKHIFSMEERFTHRFANLIQLADIQKLLAEGQTDAAFQQALSASDLSLVIHVCEKLNPMDVFQFGNCVLPQPVILSLIQQLSANLGHNTELKHRYLEAAVLSLEPTNSLTREHNMPVVLKELLQQLTNFITANPTHKCIWNMRSLQMVTQSLLPP